MIWAFIKSIRGSDVDAGLYWLARMLAAGEDARFIARRLVILASEDIGMADPDCPAGGRCRGPGGGVRRAARGPAQPGPGRRPPGQRAQVQPGDRGPRRRPGRRGRTAGRPGAGPPARRPLPGRRPARPRAGLPVPPRRRAGLGGPALPARPPRRAGATTRRRTTATEPDRVARWLRDRRGDRAAEQTSGEQRRWPARRGPM